MLASIIANTITSPPTSFPPVAVGGEPFQLRFTLASSFFLENYCDIPAQELTAWIDAQVAKKHISAMLMIMSGAMLGREEKGRWLPMPLKAEEIAARCSAEEWAHIMKSYTEAMSKVAAAVKSAVENVAPVTPPPTAEPIN